MSVEVLLTTRNSSKYLLEQLKSIQAQTWKDFKLIISDDCSTDSTRDILTEWAKSFNRPLEIVFRDNPTGSAKNNFMSLMHLSHGDHIFFADHDDIWMPEKIDFGLRALQKLEADLGTRTPILYHCDLIAINGLGEVISGSYWKFKAINPLDAARLNRALSHATVTGCAMACNRALLSFSKDIPEVAYMHDWWINLVAASLGEVICDPEPHIMYRIHENNVSRPTQQTFLGAFRQWPRLWQMRQNARSKYRNARALAELHASKMTPSRRLQVETYARLDTCSFPVRVWSTVRYDYLPLDSWRGWVKLLFV